MLDPVKRAARNSAKCSNPFKLVDCPGMIRATELEIH
jgi:hypothetical protein